MARSKRGYAVVVSGSSNAGNVGKGLSRYRKRAQRNARSTFDAKLAELELSVISKGRVQTLFGSLSFVERIYRAMQALGWVRWPSWLMKYYSAEIVELSL